MRVRQTGAGTVKNRNKWRMMMGRTFKDMPEDEQGPRVWHYKPKGHSNRVMGHSPVTQVVMMGIQVTEHSQFRTVVTRKGRV